MIEVWLGVIAVALLVMAAVQVGAAVAAARVARRLDALRAELDRDVKPVLANLTAMTADAARAASVAASQVERISEAAGDLLQRGQQIVTSVEHLVRGPVRNGAAVMAGLRAAVVALRSIREASSRRRAAARAPGDEDDSLFIG